MKNKLYLAGLFLPLLCFLAAVGIYEYRQTRAYEITVPVSGYDPRSLIAGHYILLTVDESRINCAQFPDNSCPPAGFFEKSYKYFTPEGDARPLEEPAAANQRFADQRPKLERCTAKLTAKIPNRSARNTAGRVFLYKKFPLMIMILRNNHPYLSIIIDL